MFARLPAGSYPVFVLLAPIAIGAALFFFGVSWFLRKRGIATFTSEKEELRQIRLQRENRAPEFK
jgi:hypothetical protein